MLHSSPPEPTVRIFLDFDGTIVQQDVGDAFFEHFCGMDMWKDNDAFINREITAREVFDRHLSCMRKLDEDDIRAFCESFEIDQTFPQFVMWAKMRNFPLMILSDGLDIYINLLLNRNFLNVPFRANHFEINNGKYGISLPYTDPECPWCGNCKRNHMLIESSDQDIIVLVGDGYSDFCVAQYADLVLAKGALEKYCQRENITFRKFSSFVDVQDILSSSINSGKLRRSKRAEVLRKSVWMSG